MPALKLILAVTDFFAVGNMIICILSITQKHVDVNYRVRINKAFVDLECEQSTTTRL